MKNNIYLLSLMVVLAGCSATDDSNSTIVHPTEENLPNPKTENEFIIQADEVNIGNTDQQAIVEKLNNREFILSQTGGLSDEMFGIILDVEIDHRNRVYILDQNRQEVVVFDEAGNHLTTIAGEGKGPGEVEYAESMAIYNDEWLLIEGSYRIEVYDISGEEIEFSESIQLDRSPRSICVIDDHLFLHPTNVSEEEKVEGQNFVNTIYKYSLPDFSYVDSFGESYRSENIAIMGQLSLGTISCDKSTKSVVYSFDRFPIIQGYDADSGKLKWKTSIEGLSTVKITTSNPSGRTRISYGRSGDEYRDRFLSGIDVENEYMLFQVDRIMLTEGSFGMDRRVLTALINTKTGQGNMVSEELPLLFGISDEIIVSVHEVFSTAKMHAVGN